MDMGLSHVRGIKSLLLISASFLAFISPTQAQGHGWSWGSGNGDGDEPWNGHGNGGSPWGWYGGGGSNGNGGGNGNGNLTPSQLASLGFTASSYANLNRALIAHAVVACLVWAFLVPVGAIILRVDLRGKWVLRAHAILQVTSFLAYIAAAGLGIWLTNTISSSRFSAWDDPHPRLGLAILGLAFFQPVLGVIHHSIRKRRIEDLKAGGDGKPPGRTMPGYMHLWLGRSLIVLGIINGGLGIQLAGGSPFQSKSTTRKAAIGYGVGAAVIFLVYFLLVVRHERRRTKSAPATPPPQMRVRQRGGGDDHEWPTDEVPPSYVESQENLAKQQHQHTTRYM